MAKTRNQKNATPEGLVRYAHTKDFKAIVYDDFSGIPYTVTFLGNRWWLTTPNEELQPLEDYLGDDEVGFCFLCEAGGKVGALALAKMLGKALTNPEDAVDDVLRWRVESLKRLGVMLDVKDEPLLLEMETIANEDCSYRQGKYSVVCRLHGNYYEQLFDIDAFESKRDAEEWAGYYFDLLKSIGIEFTII